MHPEWECTIAFWCGGWRWRLGDDVPRGMRKYSDARVGVESKIIRRQSGLDNELSLSCLTLLFKW